MTWNRLSRLACRCAGGLGLAALGAGASGAPERLWAQQGAPAALAFHDVTVIDVTDGRRLSHQTVVVVGNRVQAVGPADKVQVPKGAQVVDAQGKYLIPGLWDMHVHPDRVTDQGMRQSVEQYRLIYPRYIANGITGIREMAQRWPHGADSFRVWQREILAGAFVGPRTVGPSADLSSEYVSPIETANDARRVIDSLKAAGDLFVKFHGSFGNPDDAVKERNLFFALLREARRVGFSVVGHIPASVTSVEAADSGLRSIEHLHEHRQCWPAGGRLPDSTTALEEACARVAQAYIRNGTWLVPTTVLAYRDWDPQRPDAERFLRMMHRLGVRKFLAGTDDTDNRTPGLTLREELVSLAKAGLTPLEALQAGTLNPALFFEATDSLGTVTPGKLADLVLLDADPLADITNVLKLWGVVANGRYFDRATLERMDLKGVKPGDTGRPAP